MKLMNSLAKFEHLKVQVFQSISSFKDFQQGTLSRKWNKKTERRQQQKQKQKQKQKWVKAPKKFKKINGGMFNLIFNHFSISPIWRHNTLHNDT